MSVTLTGALICRDQAEADHVARYLPEHIRLTRAEPGCLRFSVVPDPVDPLRFVVDEEFVDAAAFDAHQERTAQSLWFQETRGIPRDFTVSGRE